MKLLTKITSIFIVVTIISIVIGGYISFNIATESLGQTIGENHLELAKKIITEIDRQLSTQLLEIHSLSESEILQLSLIDDTAENRAHAQERFGRFADHTGFHNFLVITDMGSFI